MLKGRGQDKIQVNLSGKWSMVGYNGTKPGIQWVKSADLDIIFTILREILNIPYRIHINTEFGGKLSV